MGFSTLKFTCEASYPGSHLSRFCSSLSFTSSGSPVMKIVRTYYTTTPQKEGKQIFRSIFHITETQTNKFNLIGVVDEDGGRVGRRRSCCGSGCRGRGGGCWGPLLVVGVDASSCHLVVDSLVNNNQDSR